MRSVHPFPARMAPQLAIDSLLDLPSGSRVLDPMCGSGTVVRAALDKGHSATGFDLDPLARMMTSVWCRRLDEGKLEKRLAKLVSEKFDPDSYISTITCRETKDFIERWFAPNQLHALSHLAGLISRLKVDDERTFFNIALSRIIITKTVGASLAWDVSHSRPHLKKIENNYDVFAGFLKSATNLLKQISDDKPSQDATINDIDSRHIGNANYYDAIVTSPPYLNAIDYIRGHKFSLVWMNHTIPNLRSIRGELVGSERMLTSKDRIDLDNIINNDEYSKILRKRTLGILRRYIVDTYSMMSSFHSALKSGGRLTIIIGNSVKDGIEIRHDKMYEQIACLLGFSFVKKTVRPIEIKHRYLPFETNDTKLSKRMKEEIVIQFFKA